MYRPGSFILIRVCEIGPLFWKFLLSSGGSGAQVDFIFAMLYRPGNFCCVSCTGMFGVSDMLYRPGTFFLVLDLRR